MRWRNEPAKKAQFAAKQNTQQKINHQLSDVDGIIAPLSGWIRSFTVVIGGDDTNRLFPVVPYARFQKLQEAEVFRANVLRDFPSCRISRENFVFDDDDPEEDHRCIFYADLTVKILTNEFAPKIKANDVLLMRRGIFAEEGDLVAIGQGDDLCRRVDYYHPDLDYFAVAVSCQRDIAGEV